MTFSSSSYLTAEEGAYLKKAILDRYSTMKDFASATHVHPTILSRFVHGALPLDAESAATMYDLLDEDSSVRFLGEYLSKSPHRLLIRHRHSRNDQSRLGEGQHPKYWNLAKAIGRVYKEITPDIQRQMEGDLEGILKKYSSPLKKQLKRQAL